MTFEAVLLRQLTTLREELAAAAAADAHHLQTQIAELTAARDRFRADAEELTTANDALSLELEACAADREAATAASAAAAAERERAGQAVAAAESERERADHALAALARERERSEQAVAALVTERERTEQAFAAVATERERAEQAKAAATAERERAEQALATLQAERERADQAIAAAARERERAEQALAAVNSERERGDQAIAARDRDAAARVSLETELARLQQQVGDMRAQMEAESARLAGESAAARAAADAEINRLHDELSRARSGSSAPLAQHLSLVFEELGRSASNEAALGAAANGLPDEFSRVVVFGVTDGRLELRYHRGFTSSAALDELSPTVGDATLLGQAALATELLVHAGTAPSDGPFPQSAALIVTAPVHVGGELVALLYADDQGRHTTSEAAATAARTLDIIRRHAALRLERLAVELKTGTELRSYARMLLEEIEYVYRADVGARKPDAERQQRLTENLRCARQVYEQRVAVDGPGLSGLLDEMLAATITAKAATPFGRELAAVAGV